MRKASKSKAKRSARKKKPKRRAARANSARKKKPKQRTMNGAHLDKKAMARHRYRKKRHRRSVVNGHHKRALHEAQLANDLLKQIAKHHKPSLDKRHYSNDPEYAFAPAAMQEFKRGFSAPDVSFWRPQGPSMPPHRGNFPGWQPEWVHTYAHPHEFLEELDDVLQFDW